MDDQPLDFDLREEACEALTPAQRTAFAAICAQRCLATLDALRPGWDEPYPKLRDALAEVWRHLAGHPADEQLILAAHEILDKLDRKVRRSGWQEDRDLEALTTGLGVLSMPYGMVRSPKLRSARLATSASTNTVDLRARLAYHLDYDRVGRAEWGWQDAAVARLRDAGDGPITPGPVRRHPRLRPGPGQPRRQLVTARHPVLEVPEGRASAGLATAPSRAHRSGPRGPRCHVRVHTIQRTVRARASQTRDLENPPGLTLGDRRLRSGGSPCRWRV